LLLVIADQGLGLLAIDLEAVTDGLLLIIFPLDELPAALVTHVS
jgi:hypothetical protein